MCINVNPYVILIVNYLHEWNDTKLFNYLSLSVTRGYLYFLLFEFEPEFLNWWRR